MSWDSLGFPLPTTLKGSPYAQYQNFSLRILGQPCQDLFPHFINNLPFIISKCIYDSIKFIYFKQFWFKFLSMCLIISGKFLPIIYLVSIIALVSYFLEDKKTKCPNSNLEYQTYEFILQHNLIGERRIFLNTEYLSKSVVL